MAKKKFKLKNIAKPNLYRDIFPYNKPPLTKFEKKTVPLAIPKNFWITDTTFRDGQQARPPYTVKQVVDIFDMLHRLSGPKGIIRASEFFLYSKRDKEAVEKCLEKGYKFPEVTGWIRAVKSDFHLVKEMGLKETGILTSASDYHIFLKLKMNRQQAMDSYLTIIQSALEEGIRVRCHLEDITRADFYGFILPFAQATQELSAKYKTPVKIRLCDTMGFGIPHPQATLPRSVPKLIHGLIHEGGVPAERLEWHGHNDFHKVLINASTAWLYGCAAANGTLLGFGERTGNPPIEGLVMDYTGLKGTTDGMDTQVITEIANYFRHEVKVPIAANYPFVGTDFNVTRAGIHADGLIKNEEIYNIFNTKKVLNHPIGVSITDKSGTAGITYWINFHLELKGNEKVDKRDPGVIKIFEWVENQYKNRRTTSISPEEMMTLAKKYLPQCLK